jgi:hypothetical protein
MLNGIWRFVEQDSFVGKLVLVEAVLENLAVLVASKYFPAMSWILEIKSTCISL